MADYANQHFLPKSYLKNFATDSEQKHIGIYVSTTRKFIKSGGIKSQCRKLNFYGEDGVLEKKLGVLESEFQKLVLTIIESKQLPDKDSDNFQTLLRMWQVTSMRNPEASNRARTHVARANLLSENNPFDPNKSIFDLKFDFVGQTLTFAEQMMPIVQDLQAVLLLNNTEIPFITSDNPVISYNQLAEHNGVAEAVTGTSSIGLQSFIPISPNLVIMFYDPWAYQFTHNFEGLVNVNERDVFSLNLLHFLNNLETIYFNDKMVEKQIIRLQEASIGFDKGGSVGARTLFMQKEDKSLDLNHGAYSTPVSFSAIELKFSFLILSEQTKYYKMKSDKVLIREFCREALKQIPGELGDMAQQIEYLMQHCESRHG